MYVNVTITMGKEEMACVHGCLPKSKCIMRVQTCNHEAAYIFVQQTWLSPSDSSENSSTTNINLNYYQDTFSNPNLGSEVSLNKLMGLAYDSEVTHDDFNALISFDNAEEE